MTTEAESNLVRIDTQTDCVAAILPLSIGSADLAIAPDKQTAYAVDASAHRLTRVDLESRTIVANIPVSNAATHVDISADGSIAIVDGSPSLQINLGDDTAVPAVAGVAASDVTISPDGRYLYFATAGYGNEKAGLVRVDRLWGTIATGARGFWTSAIARDSSGRVLYLLGTDGDAAAARLSAVDANSLVTVYDVKVDSAGLVGDILLTPDDSTLYLSSGYRIEAPVIQVVDAATGIVRKTIDTLPNSGPSRMVVSPDGKYVYVTQVGLGDVAIVDAQSQMVVGTIQAGTNPYGIAISADGEEIYVAGADGLFIIDAGSRHAVASLPSVVDPTGLAASPDGRTVYVAGHLSGNVGVVDVEGERLTRSIETGGDPLSIVVAPDGARAYVGSFDNPGAVYVVDTASESVVDTIELATGAGGMALTPDGRRLLVASYGFASVSVIDTRTDMIIDGARGLIEPRGIVVTPDGAVGLVGGQDALYFFDFREGSFEVTDVLRSTFMNGPIGPCGMVFRRDGARAYVTDVVGGNVYAVDTIRRQFAGSASIAIPFGSNSCGLALPPDEQRIYVANNANGAVSVLDGDLQVLHHIPVPADPYDVIITCDETCATAVAMKPTPPLGLRACHGDCNGSGLVTINDLIRGVRIALGEDPLATCPSFDADANGVVSINELVLSVGDALTGCPRC